MGTDDVTAILAGIRERSAKALPGFSSDVRTYVDSANDVPSLVAAVEAVLKLADEACELEVDGARMDWWDTSPTRLRETIIAALTGD